jgi:hypothetical protein
MMRLKSYMSIIDDNSQIKVAISVGTNDAPFARYESGWATAI